MTVGDGDGLKVGDDVGGVRGDRVTVGDGVNVAVSVGWMLVTVLVGVTVDVFVDVCVGNGVFVMLGVCVAVAIGAEGDFGAVKVGALVACGVAVMTGVGVFAEGVGVAVVPDSEVPESEAPKSRNRGGIEALLVSKKASEPLWAKAESRGLAAPNGSSRLVVAR